MQIRSVGIDLGKTTFHLVALGDNSKVLLKKKFTQKQLIAFTANMQTLVSCCRDCHEQLKSESVDLFLDLSGHHARRIEQGIADIEAGHIGLHSEVLQTLRVMRQRRET
jgi:cytochrome c553